MKIVLGQVREPLAQALSEKLPGVIRQLKCFEQPLLRRHPPENLDVFPMIRARL
jgi:hypothetical protein